MRGFAVTDVHVDHQTNKHWLLGLSALEHRDDILILTRDLTDNLSLLEQWFRSLGQKFGKVLFVPGNHELWVIRDAFSTSLKKFEKALEICTDCGILTDVYQKKGLSIVPFIGWYH